MESQAPPCTPAGTEADHSYWEQTVSTGETSSSSAESPSLPFIPKCISEYLCIMLWSHWWERYQEICVETQRNLNLGLRTFLADHILQALCSPDFLVKRGKLLWKRKDTHLRVFKFSAAVSGIVKTGQTCVSSGSEKSSTKFLTQIN